jgi:hypothetical protein
VIEELLTYLEERQQKDCADYFTLRLQDLPASEIRGDFEPHSQTAGLFAATL